MPPQASPNVPNGNPCLPGQPNITPIHRSTVIPPPVGFSHMGPSTFVPQVRPLPFNHRQSLDSEKLYQLVVIKYDNPSGPSMYSFPVTGDALPERLSLQYLSSLTSDQLKLIHDTMNDMNAKLAEATEAAEEAKAKKENSVKEFEIKGEAVEGNPTAQQPKQYQEWELAQESDYERPWVLEGIEVELEPETIYRVTKRAETGRPIHVVHGQEGHHGNSNSDRALFGINTWKPTPGVKKDIAVVYSRWAACRGNKRGSVVSRWRGIRADQDVEVYRVCELGPLPRPPLDIAKELKVNKDARVTEDNDFVNV
ncbi:hypothetical protein BZA77DRAFT_301049 [Pyronema omphalodes]|nr:hypothetical protein BZA77DRAFT_301049 [Pyronema omphalodes]